MAIEEARLAENGRLNPVDVVKEEYCPASELVEIPVAAASDQDLEFFRRKQASCCLNFSFNLLCKNTYLRNCLYNVEVILFCS